MSLLPRLIAEVALKNINLFLHCPEKKIKNTNLQNNVRRLAKRKDLLFEFTIHDADWL